MNTIRGWTLLEDEHYQLIFQCITTLQYIADVLILIITCTRRLLCDACCQEIEEYIATAYIGPSPWLVKLHSSNLIAEFF